MGFNLVPQLERKFVFPFHRKVRRCKSCGFHALINLESIKYLVKCGSCPYLITSRTIFIQLVNCLENYKQLFSCSLVTLELQISTCDATTHLDSQFSLFASNSCKNNAVIKLLSFHLLLSI